MVSRVCIFEDSLYPRLLPLAYFRPTFNLRCGILSLKEKVMHAFPRAEFVLHTRSYLADYMRLRNAGIKVNELSPVETLFINGRVIMDRKTAQVLSRSGMENTLFMNGDTVVAARADGRKVQALRSPIPDTFTADHFEGMKQVEIEATVVRYPWDLIRYNGDELRHDYARLVTEHSRRPRAPKAMPGVYYINKKNIFVHSTATLQPGVVIDASDGPVYIGAHVTVMPFSAIYGPSYVGNDSFIKVGSKIYHENSIGPVCKVGGELECCIIHSHSNKQHDGFLGHSYIGAWVNCGAGTVTSDLKNNYSTVSVYVGGTKIDTVLQFCGLTVGDHSKTAINSMFNTGTVVGVSSNIFGSGFPPKYVPSFSWGAAGETFTTYNVDKAIDVARKVMARRHITLSQCEEMLFRKIFELTAEERRKRGMPL